MKKLIYTTLFIFAIIISNSGIVYSANEYFRSIASGPWSSPSTWEMSLNNSTWSPATSTPDATSNFITVRYPNVVTVTSNVSVDQLGIDSGTVSINAGVVMTLLDGSGVDFTILKGGTVTGAGTFRNQGVAVEMNLRAGSNFNAALNVNTGITYAFDYTTPYDGSLFGNVTIDAGATINGGTVTGRHLSIFGNVINNGTMTASSSGGSYSINGSSLVNNGVITTPGILYFEDTTSVSGNGTFTPARTIVSGIVTMLTNVTYSPSSYFTLYPGAVLNPNGNTFTLTSGDMGLDVGAEISSPGTIRTQNTVRFDIRPGSEFNANLVVNTGIADAYSFVSPYDGSVYGNVTIDAGATLNCGNVSGRSLSMFGNVINNGTITATSTGGAYGIHGPSLVNNGIFTCAGAVYMDSATSISGNGSFTPSITVVSGNVTLLSNITYSPSSYITMASGAVLNPNGYTFTLTSGDMGLDVGAEISSPGTIRTQNAVRFDIRPGSEFNANLIVNTGIADAYSFVSPYDGSIYGNVTIDAGALLNCGNVSGKSLSMFGSVFNNGTLTTTSTGGSIRLKGANIINNGTVNPAGSLFFDTTTALAGSGNFTSFANLSANANVTLNSAHQMHGIVINAGASFNISNNHLKLTASNPITQNGTFTNVNSKIEYNGTLAQSVSTANIVYSGLRINNSAGAVFLGNVTVNDTLSVILGSLNLNGKIITISPTGYLTETPGNVIFGTTGYLTYTRNIGTPASLNVGGLGAVLTATSNLGVTEIRRGHTVQAGLGGGTSIKRYYDITPANNSGLNANLVFNYDDTELNGKPEPLLKLYKSTNSGSTWQYMVGSVNINTNQITLNGITSFSRWSSDSSGASASIKMIMAGFYNASTNKLSMDDTVRVYMRNTLFPYAVVDSAKAVLNSTTFGAGFQFVNATSGTYYLQMKHRNTIETWSNAGLIYNVGTTLNYDFTFAQSYAFGSNQSQVDASPLRFGMYSGDVNQDGVIDAGDISPVENDVSAGTTGYVPTDVNGDDFVDAADLSIVENNVAIGVSAVTP